MTYRDYFNSAAKEYASKIDDGFRMRLKPKPKWIPTCAWFWALDKLLVMEFFQDLPNSKK